ncbi:hypothetical protein PR202_ga01849 [Eleusine coracana subsp. coracana]|uniref:Uncharacterized protein n=1 Tax=Eleusine coracana subsp. coracana TaxID=191504 RepID=A0AAV5BIH2_ELECO|nr:hypothetical protein PR202_ga01162 [Eleusine coracana subsp. coracana]GJM86031.1 hypothetical protein PR202_ga01849 [Eleusine coracana subsp. coracana]
MDLALKKHLSKRLGCRPLQYMQLGLTRMMEFIYWIFIQIRVLHAMWTTVLIVTHVITKVSDCQKLGAVHVLSFVQAIPEVVHSRGCLLPYVHMQ